MLKALSFSSLIVLLVGLTALTLNVKANPCAPCDTPTIDFIRELAAYKGLQWGWSDGERVCVFSRDFVSSGVKPVPLTCLQVSPAENASADLCN